MLHALRAFLLCLMTAMTAACSSNILDDDTPTAPSPPTGAPAPGPPAPGTVVTVTASGVTPPVLTVPVGSRVTFVNADSRPHDFAGGPDPTRPQCPEIDVAGFVAAGQSRQTGVFTTAQTCEYHDHAAIGVAAFQGRIVVQ